ncbi:hypothetical protein WJX72_008223 [[Myrmecia] bisecta]|uniref:DSBA-like thioredoxin domain-containing protein n=1 Tax=[Myrmecia] bisecta TaxID=41462 RepID=A0AAW1PUT9_9CHLO
MASLPASTIRIDVWSDLACPWCYVGKRRLDKALDRYKSKVDFDVTWHPYMIDPRTNQAGEEYLAYNRRRWGSDGWTTALRQSGRPDGATFSDWKWWPNTLHAHRLAAFGAKHGKGHETEDRLFRCIYEEGGNVSLLPTLATLGHELELPDVGAYLESDEGREEVLQQDAHAKDKLDIHSVPCFAIANAANQRLMLSGAQNVAAFERAFDQMLPPS